jgi:hypothetical protein
MSDAKNRGKSNVMPKHKTRIPEERFWLRGLNEVDLIRHANIRRGDLLAENNKVLGCLLFCRRGRQTRGAGQTGNVVPGRQVYLLVVLHTLPTNLWRTGMAADGVRRRNLVFFTKAIGRVGIATYNHFSRREKARVGQSWAR